MEDATLNTYKVPHTPIKCPYCGSETKKRRARKAILNNDNFAKCHHCNKTMFIKYRESSEEGIIIAKQI